MGCGPPECRATLYDDLHHRELAAADADPDPTFRLHVEILLLNSTSTTAPLVLALESLVN
eukprot:2194823-Prymnesium_polylepis.1